MSVRVLGCPTGVSYAFGPTNQWDVSFRIGESRFWDEQRLGPPGFGFLTFLAGFPKLLLPGVLFPNFAFCIFSLTLPIIAGIPRRGRLTP